MCRKGTKKLSLGCFEPKTHYQSDTEVHIYPLLSLAHLIMRKKYMC